MKLVQRFLTNNPCYQANLRRADSRYTVFQDRGPRGLMLHSVGCAQPDARVFIRKWDRADYTAACVHGFIDGSDGTVWQTLPWNYRGWHAGGSANNTHLGIEMCEPDCLVYGKSGTFTVNDRARAEACVRRTYAAAVELFALLCAEYGLDPLQDICSHAEGGRRGIATAHADPEHLWRGLGLEYTMDGFRQAVADRLQAAEDPTAADEAALQARIEAYTGPWIQRIGDVPDETVRAEVRQLLDCGAIDGGTDDDPDDVRLPYHVLRALVMAKRYCEFIGNREQGTGNR